MPARNWLGVIVGAACLMSGCNSDSKVTGVVKLDGNPIEGATVTFVSEDGKNTFSGSSDASGNFTVSGPTKSSSIPSGTYKVLVVKPPKGSGGGGPIDPSSPDYVQQMKKEKEEADKAATPKGMPKGMPPGMKMPGAPPAAPPIRSDLPTIYAALTTTPLSVKVPPDSSPIVLDLKSKP